MKTTAEAAELLDQIRHMLELNGENPFKVRAFERASHVLQNLGSKEDLTARAKAGSLTELEGIGKGIAEVLTDFLVHGKTTARDDLLKALPAGLLELTQVPGLGPKKARQLIDELGIHSVAELEYACRENRLLNLKGFGEKVQKKISDSIQFMNSNRGQKRIDEAFEPAEKLFKKLLKAAHTGRHPAAYSLRVSETGALRRRMEVLSQLDFLVEIPSGEKAAEDIQIRLNAAVDEFVVEEKLSLPVKLHFAQGASFGYELARTTATEAHWEALLGKAHGDPKHDSQSSDEEKFYASVGVPWIPPEARETGEEVSLAKKGGLSKLLPWDGIRGVFHNHTTRSDGSASLEEMVVAAKKLGYQYIGISDHSQSAFYAQGLRENSLLSQEYEVREVQEKHPDIRVFWGIESDILQDGALDYEPSILKKFDFVVASVHSRFNMDRAAMTERILTAIRNPYTRFLGHATGRLLLGRKGYELDMEKIIEEAAKCDVAIEINANPARLDIDWRWGKKLREFGTMVSVNPDAHETVGLEDTRFGIAVARKALLSSDQVINSRDTASVEKWLKRK